MRTTLRRLCHSLALLSLMLMCSLAADTPPSINPLGITFDYKLAWIDAATSTYGAILQATRQPTFTSGTEWSLLIRYAPDAQVNVSALSPGWGLGSYDHASWLLLPAPAPFEPLRLTIHSSSNMALETDIANHAVPTSLILVPTTRPSADSTGYALISGRDYTVNDGVNLAELPKAAFGPWLVLANAAPAPLPAAAAKPSHTSTTAASATDDGNDNERSVQESGSPMATVLPPAKFIKGDPNYDPEVNPIGTMFGAPLIGPCLVNTLLGIGVLAHVAGTLRRMHFKRQYQLLVSQSKAGTLLA